MAVVTMKQLLGAGVHFGHQTRRWNPKMRRFILGERNGIYLIDLRQTMKGIEESYAYTRDLVAGGGTILFVGTKKQTQGPVATYADACGMPYVNERWLGGMLTNFQTVSTRVKRMQEFEAMQKAGDFDAMPKKEALRHTRELEKLQRNLGGIRGLDHLPDAVQLQRGTGRSLDPPHSGRRPEGIVRQQGVQRQSFPPRRQTRRHRHDQEAEDFRPGHARKRAPQCGGMASLRDEDHRSRRAGTLVPSGTSGTVTDHGNKEKARGGRADAAAAPSSF